MKPSGSLLREFSVYNSSMSCAKWTLVMSFNRVINRFRTSYPQQRRPIVLLEVMIALTLVILLVLPWVRAPIKLYRLEMEQLAQIENQRTADWIASEIKESLYNKEILWEKLPGNRSSVDCPIKKVGCSCRLICRRETVTKQGTLQRLLEIRISFPSKKPKKQTCSYLMIVRKI